MTLASFIRTRLLVSAAALAAGVTVAAAGDEIGTILAVRGAPVTTSPSGQFRKAALLQRVRDGETIVFKAGDRLVVCNEQLGAVIQIDGPGAVSLGRSGVTSLAASPRVLRMGPCDDGASVDSNGGVILRGIAPNGRARRLLGKE